MYGGGREITAKMSIATCALHVQHTSCFNEIIQQSYNHRNHKDSVLEAKLVYHPTIHLSIHHLFHPFVSRLDYPSCLWARGGTHRGHITGLAVYNLYENQAT